MIAVDTNILVYAANNDAPFHGEAKARLEGLAEGEVPWAIAWPCVHEFLAIMTNSRIHRQPMPMEHAIFKINRWMESPSLRVIGESKGYWPHFCEVAQTGKIEGALVHDAKIASICLHHGVQVLWTADRDFARFPQLKTINPLVTK
jgi:toxin-antitoxin system PIN domain toxin